MSTTPLETSQDTTFEFSQRLYVLLLIGSITSQPIIIDGKPRTIWDGNYWQYDVINRAKQSLDILIPHKIHYVTPYARFIVIMRNPIYRLVSDYTFFTWRKKEMDGQDFHDKVFILCFAILVLTVQSYFK